MKGKKKKESHLIENQGLFKKNIFFEVFVIFGYSN